MDKLRGYKKFMHDTAKYIRACLYGQKGRLTMQHSRAIMIMIGSFHSITCNVHDPCAQSSHSTP